MRYEQAARSWTEHLRRGGTTTWSAWVAASHAGADQVAAPDGWTVPGAAQLELVRRLAADPRAGDLVASGAFARLADVVLERSAPGRGLAPAPLVWSRDADPRGSGAPRAFGAPPTDPSEVPPAELVRVGVGVLAELVVRAVATSGPGRRPRGPRLRALPARVLLGPALVGPTLVRPFLPGFGLAGPPVTVAETRRRLAAQGHVERGHPRHVALLVVPLDAALVELWSARVQAGSPVRWQGFVDRAARRPRVPPAVDFAVLARRWARRVGAERVQVVVAADDPGRTAATTARLLELRPRRRPVNEPAGRGAQRLTPDAVEVLRRVSAVLGVRLAEEQHHDAVRRLAPLLHRPGPQPLAVPSEHRRWLVARAGRIVEQLRAGGYPVEGDLAAVVPGPPADQPGDQPADQPPDQPADQPAVTGPRPLGMLGVVVDGCLRLAAQGIGEAEER